MTQEIPAWINSNYEKEQEKMRMAIEVEPADDDVSLAFCLACIGAVVIGSIVIDYLVAR